MLKDYEFWLFVLYFLSLYIALELEGMLTLEQCTNQRKINQKTEFPFPSVTCLCRIPLR